MSQPMVQAPEALREKEQFRAQMGHISRHSGVFFAGTLFTTALSYVFKVYLARVLGAEALGTYALGMTVVGLAGIFGGMGLTWAASRFPGVYARGGRNEELRSFLTWSVLSLVAVNGVLGFGIYAARQWIANRIYHVPVLSGYIYLFALIMFLGALTNFFGQLLTGYKDVARRTMIANVAGGVLTIVFTVALVEMGTGLWGYIAAQVLSAFVVLILLFRAASQLTPRAARISWRPVAAPPHEMFRFATAAFTMDLVGFLYAQTDKMILGFYLDVRSIGIYAVAASVVAFLAIALQSVNQIFSPTIADLHARGDFAMLHRVFQVLAKWTFAFTVPLAAVVVIFARMFMRVFGQDFEAGWLILVIGAVGQLVNCGVGSVGYMLLMSGNERKLVRVQLASGVLTVCCCLFFVREWGIIGAAAAAAIGNIANNVWCLVEVKRALGMSPYNRSYWRLTLPVGATLVAAIAARAILRSVTHDIVAIMLATLMVYGVFLSSVFLVGLDVDDRFIASAIWYRLRNLIPRSQEGLA